MLTRSQKEDIVKEITDKISGSKTVVLCDYKGLNVSKIKSLRASLREKQAELNVAKKTLISIALKNNSVDLDVTKLEGQVALVTGGEDEVSAPKVLADFAKENKSLGILAGLLEGSVMSSEEIGNLAKLPSKEQLLGQVVGTINAPISGFVNALAGNLRNLVQVMNSIKEAKN
jgi:large subunit ribosomal protein L10